MGARGHDRIRAGRSALFVVLALALTGCAKGCFRPHTEKVLRGPVKLTVTTSTDVYNAGVHTSHTLEVAAATPYKIGLPCDKPDLDENEAGTLVAWKCPRDEAWSLSRIVGAHHYEERRLGDLGAGKEATFGKVKSLYDAIASITADLNERGTSRPRLEVLEWLTQDLRAERGAEGVAALFAEAARYPAERDQDPWTTALAKASHPERDALHTKLCPQLADPQTEAVTYAHAAQVCPLEARHGEVALARLVADPGPKPVPLGQSPWLAFVAAARPPANAGESACKALSSGAHLEYLRAERAAIVAVTGTKCEAAASVSCVSLAVCEGHVCAEAEVKARLAAWVKNADGDPYAIRPELAFPHAIALTAAAYANGPLSPDLVRRRERAEYTPSEAAEGPPCTDTTLATGAPCRCLRPATIAQICETPSSSRTVRAGECATAFDDQKRTRGPSTRNCVPDEGARCVSSFECCAPLVCRSRGGGSTCQKPGDAGAR